MVLWQDFNVIVLTLVVMQISIIIVALSHVGVIDVMTETEKPPLRNTVAHFPKPPAAPSNFTPTDT